MLEINLLPKEYLKKGLSLSFGKTGLYALMAIGGVVVMLVGVTFYQIHQFATLEEKIEIANRRAVMLQKDIQVVDALIDVKNKITQRMAAVERLDSHRSAWVRIMTDIAKNVPEYVWLGKIEEVKEVADPKKAGAANDEADKAKNQKEKAEPAVSQSTPTVRPVRVEGYAFTLNALASFMINLMRSGYFDEVELVSSEEIKFEDHRAQNFVVSANLHYLSDEEIQKIIAQNDLEDKEAEAAAPKSTHKKLN
ncbi:MAG: PilN domain-containing protein [Candidatus Zixiibacteriota bacterium]